MTELVGNWLRFTTQQPKRKRAEAVCFFCHSKKIKCDLQVNIHRSIYFRYRTYRVLTRDRAEAHRAIRDAPTVTTRTRTAINGRPREAGSVAERPLKQNVVLSLKSLSRVVSYTFRCSRQDHVNNVEGTMWERIDQNRPMLRSSSLETM